MRVTSSGGAFTDPSLSLSSEPPSAGSGLRISTSETGTLGSLELNRGRTLSSVIEFQPVGTAELDSLK